VNIKALYGHELMANTCARADLRKRREKQPKMGCPHKAMEGVLFYSLFRKHRYTRCSGIIVKKGKFVPV
jgi:hypothetical protein